MFPSLNHALVWAEDELLDQQLSDDRYQVERPLCEVNAFVEMKDQEIETIKKYLIKKQKFIPFCIKSPDLNLIYIYDCNIRLFKIKRILSKNEYSNILCRSYLCEPGHI